MTMGNIFVPRSFERVVKERVEVLRMEHDGAAAEVKEWHAMVDLLDDDGLAEFMQRTNRLDDLPAVVNIPDET